MSALLKKRSVFWWLAFIFSIVGWQSLGAQSTFITSPFSVDWTPKTLPQNLSDFSLVFTFKIPAGHYLYTDKTKVTLEDAPTDFSVQVLKPNGKNHFDTFLNQNKEVYTEDTPIEIHIQSTSNTKLPAALHGTIEYQGCSAQICFRAIKTHFEILSPAYSETTPSSNHISLWKLIRSGNLQELGKALDELHPIWLLLLVFVGGILTDFTSCVLPIIPLTLAFVGIRRERSVFQNFTLALFLVMGMSLSYALLGLASASFGYHFGFLFQNRIFVLCMIVFYLAMAASLLGLFSVEIPAPLKHLLTKIGGSGPRGALLVGTTVGFMAAPCVTPVLASLLLWVAKKQHLGFGGLLLWVYGMGMGVLFLITGTFYSSLGKVKGGHYTEWIKKGMAVLLLIPALYYGATLFSKPTENTLEVHNGWISSFSQGLALASKEQKPMLIDFYSKTCGPCVELDQKTFSNSDVQKLLKNFIAVKIDCTFETADCTDAINHFKVIGWPTVLFLNTHQQLLEDLTLVGRFVPPEEMLRLLGTAKNR